MVKRANCEHICMRLTTAYGQTKTNSMSLLNKYAICLCFATTNQGMSPDVEIQSSTFINRLMVLTRTHARTREMGAGKITTTERVSYRPISRCVSLNGQ